MENKFKVGQKVVVLKDSYGYNWVRGSEGVIVHIFADLNKISTSTTISALETVYCVRFDDKEYTHYFPLVDIAPAGKLAAALYE